MWMTGDCAYVTDDRLELPASVSSQQSWLAAQVAEADLGRCRTLS